MKRFLLLAVVLAGCAEQHILINHYYSAGGYTVKGMYGRWEYAEKKGTTTLATGEGFEERFITDTDRDGVPDKVKYRNDTFSRGQEGSTALFTQADEDWELAKARYDIPGIDKLWREMPPDERVRRQDYFK